MTPVPLDLPLRPSEAAELGFLIFETAERKPLNDELRNRMAARAAVLRLETVRPYFGSLERDPVHPASYYVAVDGEKNEPLLLHIASSAAPTSSIFHKPLLIGRMRRPNGPEMVINALPFGPGDRENLEKFCGRIETRFFPRPQASRTSLLIDVDNAESTLPAAFESFRAIWKRAGKNLAGFTVRNEGAAAEVYSAGLSAAIRAGWREGYTAAALIVAQKGSLDAAREQIRRSALFSHFRVEVSGLLQTGAHASFQQGFSAGERGWIFDEFARPFDLGGGESCAFEPAEVEELAVRFGPALEAAGRIHEWIREARAGLQAGRSFDFELSMEDAAAPVSRKELLFWLHWLKAKGHPVQLVAPKLAPAVDLPAQVQQIAAVLRHYRAALSVMWRADLGAEVVESLTRATAGRMHYRIPAAVPDLRDVILLAAGQLLLW